MPDNLWQHFGLVGCGAGVLIGLGLLGLGLIGFGWRSRQRAAASRRWPQAPGQITRTGVRESVSHESDGRSVTRYAPVVEYAYRVDQQTYHGQRVAFGAEAAYPSAAKAADALGGYPVGKPVPVFYDPRHPANAVLERRAGGVVAAMAAGLFCLSLGACLGGALLAWGGAGLWGTGR